MPDGPTAAIAERLAAIEMHRDRLAAAQDVVPSERATVADHLCGLAEAALRADPRNARSLARVACRLAATSEDRAACISAHAVAAQAAVLLGRHRAALKEVERARRLPEGAENPELTMARLQALVHLERYADAERGARQAICAADEAEDRRLGVWARMTLADLAFRLDRPREALDLYCEVERAFDDDIPLRLAAAIASNRANALESVNRFHAAERHFAYARALFEAAGCEHTAAQVDYNSAYAMFLQGRYRDALTALDTVESTFVRLGDERHLAHAALDRAEIQLALHMAADAAVDAARAMEMFDGLGLEKEAAFAAFLHASATTATSDSGGGQCLLDAQARFERVGLKDRALRCAVAYATLRLEQNDPADAMAHLDSVRAWNTKDASVRTRAAFDVIEARVLLASGRTYRAESCARRALRRLGRIRGSQTAVDALHVVAQAQVTENDGDAALETYTRAIETLEAQRRHVPDDEYMSAFLGSRMQLYSDVVRLLARGDDVVRALQFAERAKSRALMDLLAEPGGDDIDLSDSPERERIRFLRQRLHAIYRRLLQSETGQHNRSARALRIANDDARRIEGEVERLFRAQRRRSRPRTGSAPGDVPTIAEIRDALGSGRTLVEYFIADDELITFVVSPSRLRMVRQPVAVAEVQRLVERFRYHLSRYERGKVHGEALVELATQANLERLSQILVAPIKDDLEGTQLVIVPHGSLHRLPFHALPLEDGSVIDDYEVVYAPSAAVYARHAHAHRGAKGAPAVFGLPDDAAPEIDREVRQIGARLPGAQVFLGADATFDRLRSIATQASVLHVATHGMFRRAAPMLSAIRLADRWVNLYDLYRLEIGSDLVVVSSCESGIADITNGDEVIGLTRGFLCAGAPALMTTQWRVSDATAAKWMSHFYQRLGDHGNPARAHREAILKLREQHPHPYHWAAFFLTGRPVSIQALSADASTPSIDRASDVALAS